MALKYFVCLLLAVTVSQCAIGQDYATDCTKKYFARTRQVSTSVCYDKGRRFGKAIAFDKQGKKIYEKGVRNIGGTASVTFSYYNDGAVKEATYRSQPDGGIQWEHVITSFSKDGRITNEEDRGYNQMHNVLAPPSTRTPPKPYKQEVAKCAVPYATEYWYVNNTKFPMVAIAVRKGNPKDAKASIVQPFDTMKGGEFIMAEQFVNLSDYYEFSVKPVADIPGKFILRADDKKPMSYKKEIRRVYYQITAKS